MDKRPKRRKADDNPYTLTCYETEGKYFVSFKDINGNLQNIQVNYEIFEEFNEFELEDKSQMNKYERHIEQSEQYEGTLQQRLLLKNINNEDLMIDNITKEEIIRKIWTLPIPQNRRVYMKIVNEFTIEEIAKIENRSTSAIQESIALGLTKLKKVLKNF